jgi:hypothetical protein
MQTDRQTALATGRGATFLTGLALVVITGCGTMGTARMSDGNEFVIEGSGAQSSISMKCLTLQEIRELTASGVDPSAPPATCYWVALITASSSSISKAVSAYVTRESELNDKVASIVAPTPPAPPVPPAPSSSGLAVASPPSIDPHAVAAKVVVESLTKSPEQAKAAAAGLTTTLDPGTRASVKQDIEFAAKSTQSETVRRTLDAAASSF